MSRFYFFNSSTILCFYDSSSPLPSIRNPPNVSAPWSSHVCLSGPHRNLGFFSRPTLYNQSAVSLFPPCITNRPSLCSHPILPINDQSVPILYCQSTISLFHPVYPIGHQSVPASHLLSSFPFCHPACSSFHQITRTLVHPFICSHHDLVERKHFTDTDHDP